MQNSLVNDGCYFSEKALNELANSWEETVKKGVLKITSDPVVITEVLDDLLKEFAADKLHLDSSKNPMGYIYIAAKSRAINKVTPKFRRYEVSESEVENIEKYSDEMGRSPAERVFWESRRQILEWGHSPSVEGISDNRMPLMGEMDPYLVGTPRQEMNLEKAAGVAPSPSRGLLGRRAGLARSENCPQTIRGQSEFASTPLAGRRRFATIRSTSWSPRRTRTGS